MRKLAIVIAITAAAGGLLWRILENTPVPSRPRIEVTERSGPSVPGRNATASRPSTRRIEPKPWSEPVEADAAPATRQVSPAVMRGRCVDATTSAPLAGCSASLMGWAANSQRMDDYAARYGALEWKDPQPVVTGTDGRFELPFIPPPPYQFLLWVKGPGRATMEQRVNEVAPGAVLDAGDVAMQPGTEVKGRVIEEGGATRARIQVYFQRDRPRTRGKLEPRTAFNAVSSPDGSFAFDHLFPAGSYEVQVRECQLVDPKKLEIEAGQAERMVEVKVRLSAEGDLISGFVRDDGGSPVAGADITYNPNGVDENGRSWLVSTDKQGAFQIRRVRQDPKEPVAISAARGGYEPLEAPAKAIWGVKDLVIVLKRGLGVDVVVQDGDAKKPLEQYGVRCFPLRVVPPQVARMRSPGMQTSMGGQGPDVSGLRENGVHPEGVLHVAPVIRGTQLLIVEPQGREWAPSAIHRFEMTDSGAPRQEVTVWRSVKKTVRVRKKDGTPVVETEVEVLRKTSELQIDESTLSWPVSRASQLDDRSALLLAKGSTKDDGTVELSAPAHELLTVRVMGPNHAPCFREVDFGGSESTIEIVVPSGGALAGTILPKEIVGELAEGKQTGSLEHSSMRPGVFLRQEGPERIGYPPGNAAVEIAEDGTFRISGIPPGSWQVFLRSVETSDERNGVSSIHTNVHKLRTLDFTDDVERKEIFDVTALLKAEVEGTVMLDGQPVEGVIAFFEAKTDGADQINKQGVTVASGKFRAKLWPADYRTVVQLTNASKPRSFFDDRVLRVAGGEKATPAFELQSSVVKLKVVASDGVTPVSGVRLEFGVPGLSWTQVSEPTDGNGESRVENLQAGQVTVTTWMKKYATREAQRGLYGSGGDVRTAKVDVMTLVVTPPEMLATIVLPKSAGY